MMIRWFAAQRRKRRQLELERASNVVRVLFPEPITFVAQEWIGMVNSMLHVSAEVWNAQSLERRILAFKGMSPAFSEAENRFPVIRQKIDESVIATGGSEDEARAYVFDGILAEALIAVGEDRNEVYSTLFPG